MLEAPASVLRAIAASGYQKRLAIAFTHFDLVRGQANLPTFEAQRAHVLSSVHQKLTSLKEVVGQPAVRAIERELTRDRPSRRRPRRPRARPRRLFADAGDTGENLGACRIRCAIYTRKPLH